MKRSAMTDREAYPHSLDHTGRPNAGLPDLAVWPGSAHSQPLLGMGTLGNILSGLRGDPSSDCPGPRAFAGGAVLPSAVPVAAALAAVYLVSQTVWRLRGRRGWVLRYDSRWPAMLVGLFLANCAVRNLLWLGFGIGI
mgnify:CR=1 FL=1